MCRRGRRHVAGISANASKNLGSETARGGARRTKQQIEIEKLKLSQNEQEWLRVPVPDDKPRPSGNGGRQDHTMVGGSRNTSELTSMPPPNEEDKSNIQPTQ